MKAVFAILPIFFCLLISCSDNTEKAEDVNSKNKKIEQSITVKSLENLDYTDYALSTEAEQVVSSWEQYQELAVQISYLKKADLSFFKGDKKMIDNFIRALKEGVPEMLNTNPIQSRVVIMETKILKLHDNLTLSNIDTKVRLQSIEEALEAFANLSLQINKKLERDFYDKIQPE